MEPCGSGDSRRFERENCRNRGFIGIWFERMDLVYFACLRSTIARMLSNAKATREIGTYIGPGRRFEWDKKKMRRDRHRPLSAHRWKPILKETSCLLQPGCTFFKQTKQNAMRYEVEEMGRRAPLPVTKWSSVLLGAIILCPP